MGMLDDLLDDSAVTHAECKDRDCGWAGDARGAAEYTAELVHAANEHMERFGHDVAVDVSCGDEGDAPVASAPA